MEYDSFIQSKAKKVMPVGFSATGRKPAQPANDRAWPFRWLADPREERK